MNEIARRKMFGLFLVLPAFLFVFLVLFLPAANTIIKSFTEFSPMNLQQNDFVGLKNYQKIFGNEEFMDSFFNTLHFAGVSVFFELILGLVLALILNKALAFRGVIRTAILFPWVLPTALNAIIWRWLFNTDFGFFNSFMKSFGLISRNINWLGEVSLAMNSMIWVAVWKTSSFIALILLTGLQSINDELYEAASIDGASGFQKIKSITLPLLIPSILLALLFRSMDALRSFELPFALTQGGPGGATQTLSLFGYRQFFQFLKFDQGAAVSVVQFLFILVLGLIYIRVLKGERDT
ncbi:MAG: sugar ABC transporter permease [Spirochaetales bacterium]|nr:sugar ABC transporter permease [Spirochaetales bacterium]